MFYEDFKNDQVHLETLPRSESIALDALNNKYKTIMYIGSLWNLILPLGWTIACFIFDFWQIPLLSFGVLFILLLMTAVGIILIPMAFKFKGYALRDHDIVFQTGLLFRTLTIVPFNRVQHCEIRRTVMSRLFGLSMLNVYTAGGSGSDLSIPGISAERAEVLCAFILNKVKQQADEEE
jgi:uncharacterized protein